ncbi:primary-amine oxidase [Colletotrichum chrysophilum]|uniref:Amine oxidase n=1 Tax=Colletotrichum chrysophilum TaxID=1836956 RepID=A0AAD9EHT2_9PEZI|nr:primary-amine oxidase [Colletotrichum chrysophilum]
MPKHPLDPLSVDEVRKASQLLLQELSLPPMCIRFKVVDLAEPSKDEVLAHLQRGNRVPDRKARIYYHQKNSKVLTKSILNVSSGILETTEELPDVQGPVDWVEYDLVTKACNKHPAVLAEIAKLKVPPRLPLGVGDELDTETQPWTPVEPVEYSANILGTEALRKDLKPLHIIQPEGPSFQIDDRTVLWQKWQFQLGWSLREGPILHDVRYGERSLFYRVSMSEMTVPYGDPRTPYHRKQAFDLGDSGFGLTSNSLALGCDCLGHIAYFDGVRVSATGDPVLMPNVVCMHEVDDGIGWKHTNFRNGKSSVVRDRKLVIQCTSTVANYEYILAFVLDQAANLHIEVRATGILSTMPIRPDLSVSPWGTVVAPGVLAVNHQHLFCVRIDPILDGERNNTVVRDDCLPVRGNPNLDPFGCAFRVKTTPITKPGGYDLDLSSGRTYRITNPSRVNEISGKPAGYKLHAAPSQMLMMGPETFNHRRGTFASKPIWVTRYRDDELWAAGEFTNQSREDTGLATYATRDENVENEDVVLWHCFGLTHVTRPEG